jgi:hypothetical protein
MGGRRFAGALRLVPALLGLGPALLGLCLAGCADPFGVERHRLGPPRIAALGVVDGQARAALWSGLGLFHDRAPRWAWTLDGEPIGEGFAAPIPADALEGAELRLDAEVEGEALSARLSLRGDGAPVEVSRHEVLLGADLSVDDRLDREAQPVEVGVGATSAARLRVEDRGGRSMRWMLAGPEGALLELDADQVDLLRHKVVYEDGELLQRARGPARVYSTLALAIDGTGQNAWRWVDVAMGMDSAPTRVGQRLVSLEGELPEADVVDVIVSKDDAALPLGLRVELLGAAAGAPPDHPCATDGLLSLDELAEGRCTRDEVDGQRFWLRLR